MSPEEITSLLRHVLFTALELAAPPLLIALAVGLAISLFQAMTHMHEMTLSFVPKMLLTAAAVAFLFPWMLKILTKLTTNLLVYQWDKITDPIQYAF